MQLICPCLNVTLNVVVEDEGNFDDVLVKTDEQIGQICGCEDDSAAIEDEFFSVLCSGGSVARFVLDSEKGIHEKLPVLLKRRRVDRWEIRRCILCNTDAYAIASANYAGQVLVNIKLFLHEESVISERRKSAEISPTFQVILPKMNEIDDDRGLNENLNNANHSAGNKKSGFSNGVGGARSSAMIPRGALHSVQSVVGQHLRREQERMEERIRAYTEEQQAAFDRSKSLAKSEKLKVLSILAKNGMASGGGGGSGSTSGFVSSTDWSSFGSVSGSGGGAVFGDEEFDSAVPLSPMSMTSGGDPSPGYMMDAKTPGITSGSFRMTNENTTPLRPKAHSNPASLTGWKRKRHSGGPGLAPSLSSHPEEQQDIFSFEEQDNDDLHNLTSYLPADDEGDTTDDSGTGEDYKKYYPPPPPPPASVIQQAARTIVNSSTAIPSQHRQVNYCTSLPVRVPEPQSKGVRWGAQSPDENNMRTLTNATAKYLYDPNDLPQRQQNQRDDVNEENEDDEEEEEDDAILNDMDNGTSTRVIRQMGPPPKDVGASMQALARSIQSADDPERLFGERPQRRRYKTGDNSNTAADLFNPQEFSIVPQRIVAANSSSGTTAVDGRARKPSVVVLFKEEQNF